MSRGFAGQNLPIAVRVHLDHARHQGDLVDQAAVGRVRDGHEIHRHARLRLLGTQDERERGIAPAGRRLGRNVDPGEGLARRVGHGDPVGVLAGLGGSAPALFPVQHVAAGWQVGDPLLDAEVALGCVEFDELVALIGPDLDLCPLVSAPTGHLPGRQVIPSERTPEVTTAGASTPSQGERRAEVPVAQEVQRLPAHARYSRRKGTCRGDPGWVVGVGRVRAAEDFGQVIDPILVRVGLARVGAGLPFFREGQAILVGVDQAIGGVCRVQPEDLLCAILQPVAIGILGVRYREGAVTSGCIERS